MIASSTMIAEPLAFRADTTHTVSPHGDLPMSAAQPDDLWLVTIPTPHHRAFWGQNLVEKAWLDTLSSRITASPLLMLVRQGPPAPAPASRIFFVRQTAAEAMVAELRFLSGLTNEELAPLAGVSRRSLQSWLVGGAISARKEQRLRSLVDAIREIDAGSQAETRTRLFDRRRGSVRPYDLLAEGRFQSAVGMVAGQARSGGISVTRELGSLEAQLSRLETPVEISTERSGGRFSGRLQRR